MASSSEVDDAKLYSLWRENLEKGKQAIKNGNLDNLATALKSHHSLNFEPSNKHTLDHWLAFHAVEAGSIASLDVIFRGGNWNIDTPEDYCYPPLLGKVIRDGYKYNDGKIDMDLVNWFLNHGANPNAYGRQYAITPLSYAVRYGNFDLVQLLFKYGGLATEGDLIHYLIHSEPLKDYDDFVKKFRFLTERGASVNEALFERFPKLEDVTIFTYTPLINACGSGNPKVVRLLLDAGADPRKACSYDYTPLQAAEKSGNKEIKKMIEEAIALLPRL